MYKINQLLKNLIRERVQAIFTEEEFNRKLYLKWKRKNVTLRGMQEIGQENGGSAILGQGLYSAALSNRSMAKGYGEVRFVVNGVPKHPKIIKTLNEWQIFIQGLIMKLGYVKHGFPDNRRFEEETSISKEMQKLGYDGVIIPGREMVNYTPEKVMYFQNEVQLMDYYERAVQPGSF